MLQLIKTEWHIYESSKCHYWFRWWLVMGMVLSHYMNQWLLIVSYILRNKFQWNPNQNAIVIIHLIFKMVAILSRPQCDNWPCCYCTTNAKQSKLNSEHILLTILYVILAMVIKWFDRPYEYHSLASVHIHPCVLFQIHWCMKLLKLLLMVLL